MKQWYKVSTFLVYSTGCREGQRVTLAKRFGRKCSEGQLGLGCAVDVMSDGVCIHAWSSGCVRLSATLLTLASRLLCPCRFPGKNTVVCCRFLLQGIFSTPGQSCVSCVSCVYRWSLYPLYHQGSQK